MAAQLSSTLAALLAATNRRSPGRAWADLLMAALCAVVILGVSSSGLRARACGSAFFCALQQDHFLQQGAEGAAGPLSVVLHMAIAEQIVNELANGEGGRVHGAKCLAVLAGVA